VEHLEASPNCFLLSDLSHFLTDWFDYRLSEATVCSHASALPGARAMVASQGAAAACCAGGFGAWGHIGRGLRSTLHPNSSGAEDGCASGCDAGAGTGGGRPGGGARSRWGKGHPVGRVGVTSYDVAGTSGVTRVGVDADTVLANARGRSRHHVGTEGRSASALPVLNVNRTNVARNTNARPQEEPRSGAATSTSNETTPKKTALRLVAGVCSTIVVRTLLAPMERVKLEYQLNRTALPVGLVMSKVLKSEGIKGFWRGNGINLLRVCPYKAINFAAFDSFRAIAVAASPGGKNEVDRILLAAAGAAAGIASVCSCFPMDVVRTRLLVSGGYQKYGGLRRCIQQMYKKEGPGAFYRGFLPAMIAMTPNGAVYYTTYDRLKMNRLGWLERTEKDRVIEEKSKSKGSGKVSKKDSKKIAEAAAAPPPPVRVEQGYMMLFGAVAGAAAEFGTYPFEVIRRQMQLRSGGRGDGMSAVFGKRALKRMTTTIRIIARKHGMKGLYVGVLPSVAQVLPSAALGYYSYEMFKIWLKIGDE
jgi:hypothetical protein